MEVQVAHPPRDIRSGSKVVQTFRECCVGRMFFFASSTPGSLNKVVRRMLPSRKLRNEAGNKRSCYKKYRSYAPARSSSSHAASRSVERQPRAANADSLPSRCRRSLREPAVRNCTHGQAVNESEFAAFDTEEMGVRHTAGPSKETDGRADLGIGDEASIRELHSARHADIATIVGLTAARADAAFQTITRRPPWYLHAVVVHDVEVRIGCCNQRLTVVARGGWNRSPVFGRRVLQ